MSCSSTASGLSPASMMAASVLRCPRRRGDGGASDVNPADVEVVARAEDGLDETELSVAGGELEDDVGFARGKRRRAGTAVHVEFSTATVRSANQLRNCVS